MKRLFKVTLNWQGEVVESYHQAKDDAQALRFAIRKLADKIGYTNVYVRNHVMSEKHRRYEVEVK